MNFVKELKKKMLLHWNSNFVCRIRYPFYFFVENYFEYPFLKREFKRRTGYSLNLKCPKTFNEKLCWKKIYDRNPLLPVIADKYRVRKFLIDFLGGKEAGDILVPLLYVSEDPHDIPFELFSDYIVKANHGSGTNIIVTDGKYSKDALVEECKKWMRQPYGLFKQEWAYKDIKIKIIVEKLLRDRQGNLPIDYKFHMVHGNCEMIQINQGLFSEKEKRFLTLYTPEWKKIDVFWEFPSSDAIAKPEGLEDMLELSRKLSAPFDYVRVDLYYIEGKIYFGELTNYPTSGMARVHPVSFELALGSKWILNSGYWHDQHKVSEAENI